MFNVTKMTIDWAGRPLTLETGRIARQADGAVLATYGETSVLCTVVGVKQMAPGADFLPLSVHYQEKSYSVGRVPGGFFKREGRASERETLVSRLIDRPIRPLFVEGFFNEVQVICTVLSYDQQSDSDIVAMVGASAALTLSGIPFLGPIGGARVGLIDGELVLNPTVDQYSLSDLDLVVAGTKEGVLMVESEAKELSEEKMLEAVMFGHKGFQPVIDMIVKMAEKAAKEPWDVPEVPAVIKKVRKELEEKFSSRVREAYQEKAKSARYQKLSELKAEAEEAFKSVLEAEGVSVVEVSRLFKTLESDVVRGDILKTGRRIDGRDTKSIRPILSEVGVLPRPHGSALFTRGETQALVVTTLGTGGDEQTIDSLDGEFKENFLLHYNFPPFSVGEAGRMSGPGRREVGHGRLAWRALHPLLPSREEFPYTLRVVSEITESNGSSSMATVCGGSLSMMDAGVPLRAPVAGIAMGLIKEGAQYAVLSDILGDEDHLGDMDFKVAGTEAGITALQMDIKITSITGKIMEEALDQALAGRKHILGEMAKALTASRGELSASAPRIVTIVIPKDKIREVIGSGGKVVREICETTNTKVDISDDGTIKVAGTSSESIEAALGKIKAIACEPEIGDVFSGKVVKVMEFGAFVNFLGNRDGLVHVSELAHRRVAKVSDVVQVGDIVEVKLVGFDERGKVKLSMKALLPEPESAQTSEGGE